MAAVPWNFQRPLKGHMCWSLHNFSFVSEYAGLSFYLTIKGKVMFQLKSMTDILLIQCIMALNNEADEEFSGIVKCTL